MLDHDLGKPEFVGRNVYEFYCRKVRSQYETIVNGTERKNQIRSDYKKLDAKEHLQLKLEFHEARSAFVFQYQQYIQKLPKDKQQAEIDFLKTISDKTTTKDRPKPDKKEQPTSAMKDELHSADSADEEPPAAESTTINKKLTTAKKAKKTSKFEGSGEDVKPPAQQVSPKKRPKSSAVKAAPVASTSREPELLTIRKSESAAPSDSSSEDEETNVTAKSKWTTSRNSVSASPSKNGNVIPKASGSKKRPLEEDVKPEPEPKNSKKMVKAVKQEEEPEMPPPSGAGVKATKTKTPKQPEKPPKDVKEFYRQRIYKGKPGKYAESYANLTSAKKREISEQLKAAQKQYIVDFEQFLHSLPKDEIRKYLQKANAQKQIQTTDDDDDDDDEDDDDGEESGSSSEEEDDD